MTRFSISTWLVRSLCTLPFLSSGKYVYHFPSFPSHILYGCFSNSSFLFIASILFCTSLKFIIPLLIINRNISLFCPYCRLFNSIVFSIAFHLYKLFILKKAPPNKSPAAPYIKIKIVFNFLLSIFKQFSNYLSTFIEPDSVKFRIRFTFGWFMVT